MRAYVGAVVSCCVCLLASCSSRLDKAPASVKPNGTPLAIEMSGCAQIPKAQVCELAQDARDLTVFVARAQATVTVDAQPLEPFDATPIQGGLRLRLRVPEGASSLVVSSGQASARIAITPLQVPARMSELRALRARGELDALSTELDAWEMELASSKDSKDTCDRARIFGMRARLAFSRGEPHNVDLYYGRSVPALLACGRLSEAVDDAMAQAFTRNEQLRDLAGAHQTLADIEPRLRSYPWGAASVAYHRALLSMRLGNLGRALKQLDDAERGAERLGVADLRSITLQLRSWVLSLLGRHAQAASAMEAARVLSNQASACDRASLLMNLGWQRILAAEASASAADPRAPLQESVTLIEAHCPNEEYRAHALLNLARVAVAEGALDEAKQRLGDAAQHAPKGHGALAVALLDVQGRLLLQAGDARKALTVYEELSARLHAAGESLPVGALGRAKALLGLGRKEQAVLALQESEDELELQLATVSLGAGRETLSLGRGESADLLVDTLIQLHRDEEAFLAARRARARLLWSLERVTALTTDLPKEQLKARERAIASYYVLRQAMDALAKNAWTLPKDELERAELAQRSQRAQLASLLEDLFPAMRARPTTRIPSQGQLILGLFPLADEVVAFIRTSATLRIVRGPKGALDWLLPAISSELHAAQIVSVIAPAQGALAKVHTFVEGDTALGLTHAVEYVVDVPHHTSAQHRQQKLYIFDPRGDLSGARNEAAALAQVARGKHVIWLQGKEATRERVLAAFPNAVLMHYAGHAAYDDDAWWESSLTLADRSTLTVSDILAAPDVPQHVVLAACSTARTGDTRHLATVGLAQAFILMGAEDVIATSRTIEDRLAFAFSRAYHAGAQSESAQQFQRVTRTLHEQGLAWDAFVRLVP